MNSVTALIPLPVLAATLAAALSLMAVLWLVSLARRDAGIVDPFWGPGFALVAATAFVAGAGWAPRRYLVVAMVGIWGLRLGTHLWARNSGKDEDFRYRAMREYWGASFWWVSLFTVFMLQAALMWIISMPIQVAVNAAEPQRVTALDFAGIALWMVGLFFEAVGDAQLRRFKAEPSNRGEVLDTGLWAYTRHPNYFGDAMIWWGIFVVAAAVPGGIYTVFSPVLMTFFLVKVSGVALLERDIGKRRPAYRDYIERTSAFIPWPPKPRSVDSGTGAGR